MKEFMRELRISLNKHFYENEVDDICSYYQEMIYEREAQGEKIEDILKDYHVKDILRDMLPEVVEKRETTPKNIYKSNYLLIALLITTPFLIPLGVVYIVLISVFFAMIVTGFALMFSGIVSIFGFIIEAFFIGGGISQVLLMMGLGFITAAILMIVGYILVYIFKNLMMGLILATSKLAKKIGGKKHENN